MIKYLTLILTVIILNFKSNAQTDNTLVGTWQLISIKTIEKGDTTYTNFTNGVKGIKMLNETDFAFFQHDLKHGNDSTAMFVSGSGKYELKNDKYTEHLEYCNFREYENHTFTFNVEIKGDTLIQQGIEELKERGIKRYIFETYIRE